MSLRDSIARRAAGGPQFRLEPNRMLVELNGSNSISKLANQVSSSNPLDSRPINSEVLDRVSSEMRQLGFSAEELNNIGMLVIKTSSLEDVMNNIASSQNTFSKQVIDEIEEDLEKAKNRGGKTIVGGFRPGILNFSTDNTELEAKLMNELSNPSFTNCITEALEEVDNVLNVEISHTWNTFGPRNLNINVESDRVDITDQDDEKPNLDDVLERIGVKEVWDDTTGENAVAAIFDTSFCSQLLESDRVIDTFSGPDVNSAYSDPGEGHGTMTAYSMAGNKNTGNLSYSGVAKDSDILLARLTDKDGSLVYTAQAWDWLAGHIKDLDKPVISNHSYGVPMCSARAFELCESSVAKVARAMNKRDDHQAFYAAGNEAIYCGHRLSGMTNGINGINSDPTSLTSAAFRYDLNEAQSYSSHGFGTCAGFRENPKPDFGCMLPTIVPYGCTQKDMSIQDGGSGAGTSEASPLNAGVATLLASVAGNAKRSVLEKAMESTATKPRRTQVNVIKGEDARFGAGQVRADKALEEVME